MKPRPQDRIWNRAAMEGGGSAPREGDSALAALLLVHGMVMNGGIDHVLVAVTSDEYASGIEGFRYFGMLDVASLLEEARLVAEEEYETLDAKYGELIPSDSRLMQMFEAKMLVSPEAFAPLGEADA